MFQKRKSVRHPGRLCGVKNGRGWGNSPPFFMKELEKAAKKMLKGKAPKAPPKPEEPTDAIGWLKKAYIDHDPADGAPKVGKIGYV